MRNPAKILPAIAAAAISALLIPVLPCAGATDAGDAHAPALHTQTFKIEGDPIKFYLGILSFEGRATTNIGGFGQWQTHAGSNMGSFGPSGPSAAELQSAFTRFFSAIGVDLAAPKSFVIGFRDGAVTVHATDDDLKLIEKALNIVKNVPPEIQLTVRTYELTEESFFDFQTKWFSKLQGNNNEANGWVAGILTAPAFTSVLKTLDAKNAKDLLSKQEVTTLSGWQANFYPREPEVEPKTPVGGSVNYGFAHPLELDVVPKVDADGYTVQMTLIPTGTEFVGAGSDTNFAPVASSNGGIPITGQIPLPRSRVRQLVTNCTLWDGQTSTLVLKPPYAATNKMLVVFVTAVIIDPSGERKNATGSLPFAEKTVPSQTGH